MGSISTETTINVLDLQAAIAALLDGNDHVAMEILTEVLENYHEELEEDH